MKENNVVSAYIGLGSNSCDAALKIGSAVKVISRLDGVRIEAESSLYYTEPQDFRPQPWFYNKVIRINPGAFAPPQLLENLLRLETGLGRSRNGPRYGPRCIDLDLLLFGQVHSDLPFCLLPHPRMTQRAFVMVPLQELAPDIVIQGKTPSQWLARLPWRRDGNRLYQSVNPAQNERDLSNYAMEREC